MLQAREFACILLLAAGLLPACLRAQEEPADTGGESVQRLGDLPLDKEVELDLAVPQPDQPQSKPADDAAARQAQEQREREAAIDRNLTAAEESFGAGRIDQPPGDSAWHYYRTVLELDPDNEAAKAGLVRVQQAMIETAMEYAREFDFETASSILQDAALVTPDSRPVDQAYQEIHRFRQRHAGELEARAVQAMNAGQFDKAERALVELVALGGMEESIAQLRRRLEEARAYGGFRPGQIIRDRFVDGRQWSPETVVVLAANFMMGSGAFEKGHRDVEGPRHRVIFRRGFTIGKTEVSVGQFRQFVDRTHYRTDAEKQGFSVIYDHRSGRLARRDGINWRNSYDGRKAGDRYPVVHVSWNDASAYAKWLAQGTGKPYRLPSEAEFEYALRGGTSTPYWWGKGSPDRVVENLTGEGDVSRGQRRWETYFEGYNDRHWGPAPVASFEPNPFGLYDIGGNVGEWVADCWHDSYLRAPLDGSAWLNPGCKRRVIRGAYWASSPEQARSAFRIAAQPDRRDARIGFRIARDL